MPGRCQSKRLYNNCGEKRYRRVHPHHARIPPNTRFILISPPLLSLGRYYFNKASQGRSPNIRCSLVVPGKTLLRKVKIRQPTRKVKAMTGAPGSNAGSLCHNLHRRSTRHLLTSRHQRFPSISRLCQCAAMACSRLAKVALRPSHLDMCPKRIQMTCFRANMSQCSQAQLIDFVRFQQGWVQYTINDEG